ncbi:DUF4272 domain-containing protein [Corynebacterium tuscaniense]|uniref:DUF4272 domain-containing protein n=1 Tax=Corynebacterium tuscaniense TaxID=302449 RepID=UPI0012390A86|nr:DUF4272 domain-containing protein [Corynebacterium tuscaniense]KAA8742657.1 DUF4272 domain-containing protein [Corynebacterium tuscaniense]
MYINAYSTVRDEIPGPYSHQRGLNDPEMAGHLNGFSAFMWERGQQEMTASLFGLIRHIGNTKRQYVFERENLHGLEDWAEQTNSVFLMPDGTVVNVYGEDIVAGGAVPYHPAARARASRVRAEITQDTGVTLPAHYPPVRSEFEAVLREPREVVQRFMSLVAVSEVAGFFCAESEPPLAEIRAVLPGAFETLTPTEQRFIELIESGVTPHTPSPGGDEARHLAFQLAWQVLAAQMLAHALGIQELPEGEIRVDATSLAQWVADRGEAAIHEQATALISLPKLCDKYEFVHAMRWTAVDQEVNPERPALIDEPTAGTLLEWHRALSWLFHPNSDWEDVDLST